MLAAGGNVVRLAGLYHANRWVLWVHSRRRLLSVELGLLPATLHTRLAGHAQLVRLSPSHMHMTTQALSSSCSVHCMAEQGRASAC